MRIQAEEFFIVTINDVAAAAGVSIATVSRVINGNYPVSAEVRKRVLKAMEELQYRPNVMARGLRRQKTESVGVLIPRLNDSYLSALAYTIEKSLFDNGYRALLCSTEESLERETAYINSLLQQRVDGVIMFPRDHSRDNVERLLQEQVPVVLVERELANLAVHQVTVKNYDGAYAGMRHLIDLGHREIGVLMAYFDPFPIHHRLRGALDALRDAGLPQREAYIKSVLSTDARFELGYQQVLELLKLDTLPTAIFAMTDELAIGALHALSKHNVRVPEDVSIIGFDDIPMASFILPALTTIQQPAMQIGETAGRILLKALEDDSGDVQRVALPTRLIVRDSTAPPSR